MELKFGIVGSGSIAKVHAACIRSIPHASLVGLYTKHTKKNKELSTIFKTSIFNDGNAFFAHPDINCIVVCNESGKHGYTIEQASKNGKHILCEKPLEVSLNKIDRIAEIIKKNKIILSVVFQNRWNPEYQRLKTALEEGLLGKILLSQAKINWYRSPDYYSSNPWRGTLKWDGGAALINQGIHTIDLLLDLLGDIKSIGGKVSTRIHKIEGEDVAVAFIEFRNGALGTLSVGTALFPGHPERIEVYGSLGSVVFESGKIITSTISKISITPPETTMRMSKSNPKINSLELHKAVYIDFIKAVLEKKSPLVPLSIARKSVALIEALYDSSKNQSITLIN